ncbi:MAG: AMIN domain-containing protein [Polyangia bacterium]
MRRFVVVAILAVSAAAWVQSEGDNDDQAAAPATEKGNLNVTDKGAAEGTYKGVAPGAQALPPHPPKLPLKKGPQRMIWPGFQVKDGVPTVFLEVTAAPEYHVEDAPGAVVVTLKNTVVPLRNNRRALDVTAFATAVKEVSTTSKGRDVRVTIKTKGGDRPSHHERVEDAAGGFRILVIELPSSPSK